MAALFAELERGMIGERTKAGMAQKGLEGSHLGRRTSLAVPVIERIRAERAAGRPYAAIASHLTADHIPTATGRTVWGVSSVQSALTVNPSPPRRSRDCRSDNASIEASLPVEADLQSQRQLTYQAHRPGSSNRDLVANWPGWSLDQKRHALRSAIDRIVVSQGRLPIDQRLEITPRI